MTTAKTETKKAPGPRTDPALITKTNKVGFPIGAAVPDELRDRVGNAVKGHKGYFVRYPYASYDLAAKVGNGDGQAWMAVCRHGETRTADALMGDNGIEKVAAARKTWCAECGAGSSVPAKAAAAAAKLAQAEQATESALAESAEDRAERHQAKAVRDADLAAKKADEAKIGGKINATVRRTKAEKLAAISERAEAKKAEAVAPVTLSEEGYAVARREFPYAVRTPLAEMPEVGAQVAVEAHQTDKVGTVVKVGRSLAEVQVPMVAGGPDKVVKRHLAEMGPA